MKVLRSPGARVGRAAAVIGATVALTVGLSSTAWAHECFVANRSAQGNASVSAHSAAWSTITPEILFGQLGVEDGAALDCAVAAWKATSRSAALCRRRREAGRRPGRGDRGNNPNNASGKDADGKGIDHGPDVYGAAIGQIVGSCTGP